MIRGDKNKPLWKKVSLGTLIPFPKNRKVRLRTGETVRASEQELSHVIDQFELVENGKGEFKVNVEKKEETKPASKQTKSIRTNKEAAKQDTKTTTQNDKETTEEYSVVSSEEEPGKFDVLSSTGKKMNDKSLTPEQAEELKIELEKDQTQ